MRKLILKKILFSKEEVKHGVIFYKYNYKYLQARNDEKHILIDGGKLTIVDYSSDIREHFCYEYHFEYIDDFLLSYNEPSLTRAVHALTVSKMLEKSFDIKNQKLPLEKNESLVKNRYFNALGQNFWVVLSHCLGLFKFKEKQYLYFFTYITTLLGWGLLLGFFMGVLCLGYPANSLMFMLFIGGIIFLLNGYVDIERRIRAKKEGQKATVDTDFWIGVIGLFLLFIYAIYHYLIK